MNAGLVLLLVLTLVGVEIPVIHAHSAETPGLYNEECPLGRLALGPGGATLTFAPDPPHALAALPATPPAERSFSSRPGLPRRARAPPQAS